MRIAIPDDIVGAFAQAADIDRLRAVGEVQVHNTRCSDPENLTARISEADVVLSFRPAFTRFPASVLAACSKLRLLCISGTGVEDVDVAEASRRGIAVANVRGSSNRAVAEHALALMLDVARRVTAQDRAIRAGEWKAQQGIELNGRTVGLVGLSAIAQNLAPLCKGIGMRVLSWSRNNDPARALAVGATAVELDTLLAQSDIVSVHMRLAPELTGFFDAARFGRMKKGVIFINTARGELVNDADLVRAINEGHVRGAGLDVFSVQPLPDNYPLRALPGVVMTPASAWNTVDASERMIKQSVDNVLGFLAGRPVNVVNAAALAGR